MVWNDIATPRPRATVSLSRSQKCDLAPVFVAGAVSSALVLAVFLSDPPAAADHRPLVLAADMPTGRLVAAEPAAMESPALRPVRVPEPVRPKPARARLRTPRETAPASPAPQPDTRGSTETLSKRVTRLVVGDGRYTVRPFPTLPDER